MQPQLYIGDSRLDLYQDDAINLTQSVQSLRDLTKVFTDFTKSFKVPATPNNNAIFKHYYEAQIDNGFDARTKKAGRIDINGVTFKLGKIQLNSVGLKSNVPDFYDIEFFGNTIEIKDLIGDDTLRDLEDLDALNFDYTAANVSSKLGQNDDVAFSLTSYKRRFLWEDTNISDDSNVNIKYNASFTDGVQWDELRGYIKCSAILDAIRNQYGLNFTNNFFLRQEFSQLYMSLGNGTDKQEPYTYLDVESFSVNVYQRDGAFDNFMGKMSATLTPDELNVPYRIVFLVNGVRQSESTWRTGTSTASYDFGLVPFNLYSFEYAIETKGELNFDIDCNYKSQLFLPPFGTASNYDVTSSTTTHFASAPQLTPREIIADMKVLDWLTAIIKAFNLVIVPQNDGSLYVNDLNSWYYLGGIIDVSEYVDITELKVERGELFKEIAFKYEDTEQILANEYESQFGKQFGAEEINLDGLATDKTLEIALPFENPQFERLTGSGLQYAFIVDSTLEPYSNKPFLCYLPTVNNESIGFNTETAYNQQLKVNVPSHSVSLSGGFTAQFAAEFSEFTGGLLSDNLYSRFYSDYFSDLFSEKRRKYSLTAEFTPTLLSRIKMNDRLIIKGVRYVIDNIDTNILTGKTKLVLLNDIFDSLFIGEESSAVNSKFGIYEKNGVVSYTGNPYAVVSSEQTWITPTIGNGLVTFTLEDNKTGSDRAGLIQIEDGLSNPTITVLQPFTGLISWDSNLITFDNNIITF